MLTDMAVIGISFVCGVFQKSMQNRHEQTMMMLQRNHEDVQRVRLVKDDWFKWTRRTIALIATAYIFGMPLLAGLLDVELWAIYAESNSWLVSIFSGDSDLVVKHFPAGFVMLPIHTYIAEAIVGLYFGRK